MKYTVCVMAFLLLAGNSCKKDCRDKYSSYHKNCVFDSTTISTTIVGTWDFVATEGPHQTEWPCKFLANVSCRFDTTGIYQYMANDTLIYQGNYHLLVNSETFIYDDSGYVTGSCSICNGYLVLHQSIDNNIYSKRH